MDNAKPTEINGNPAIESTEPLSIQEAGEWALKTRAKANPQKHSIERLRCAAAKRREKSTRNPTNATNSETSYKVTGFNPESDAFSVESSDGKKLLGKSISNGNIKSGQKVRGFPAPGGEVIIDVKPKGRDIVIPKPEPKPPVEDEEFWPVTSAFLYSRIKPNQELLDGNGAADADETTWDGVRCYASPTGSIDAAVAFFENKHLLGDYDTAEKALLNQMRADRLITPAGSPSASAARDNAVWGSGSEEAVMIWFYIGNPANAFVNGKIFKTSGPPTHPNAGNVTSGGQGLCMEVYNQGSISAAIFPRETFGQGPLFQALKTQFPQLGGSVGYAGRIEIWRGVADYTSQSWMRYFRNTPSAFESFRTPTSTPSWYVPGQSTNPWLYTDSNFFQFGWSPAFVGCASSSWVLAVKSAINALDCGGAIANNQWYWGGDAAPTIGRIDWDNPWGQIATTGMYVCWAGHKDNAATAQSFFETFRAYWGITGSVTKLGSANPYGCGVDGPGGTSYPPAPPSNVSRFIGQNWGRKAEMWLKVCRQNDPPLEIKLPFEYCAVLEKQVILGGGSFSNGAAFESGKIKNFLQTYGLCYIGSGGFTDTFGLENPHATLSIDDEYAYVDILYGCERIFEQPLTLPVKGRLGNQGFGGANINITRCAGRADEYVHHTSGVMSPSTIPLMPILIKDVFTSCQSYKIRLPTKDDKTLTIVGSQKFKRGDVNTLTSKNPDWECTSKFVIHDYRTSATSLSVAFNTPRFVQPNPDFATFGGLPALNQFVHLEPANINNFQQKFYKNKADWSNLDWVYFQLMGSPRQFNPLIEVLPSGVYVHPNDLYIATIFDSDRKFGGHSRSEKVMRTTAFNNATTSVNNYYGDLGPTALFPLAIPFTEQLLGNGLMENGILTKWYRVTPSSFPLMGQFKRNP
jgi:hypothetical protein